MKTIPSTGLQKRNTENSGIEKSVVSLVRHFGMQLPGDCCNEISLVEFLALEAIGKPGDCAVQDVGGRLGFTKSGSTRLVNRLEKKGWVVKERSTADGRVCCIKLTSEGIRWYHLVLDAFRDRINGLLSSCSESDKSMVIKTLEILSRRIQ